jgi:ferritin-like metal-binding protein YciE
MFTRSLSMSIYNLHSIKKNKLTNKKEIKMKKVPRQSTTNNQNGREAAELAFGKLFEDGLKDIYWVEKQLTKAIPKMIKKTTSEELISALEEHLAVTEKQVSRVEKVFEVLGKTAKASKCPAMQGILEEADETMKETDGMVRDAAIICSAQKVEHYEIASYGSLCAFANTLGLTKAAEILKQTLDEEKEADEKLSQIAESSVNLEALSEVES